MISAARGIARLGRCSATASIYSSVRQREVTARVGETEFNFSNGKIARLADGSVLVRAGGSAVLVTAVSEGVIDESFFGAPLKVVYRDKGAAARRIPATFGRRELQATAREILTSRAIDRSLRPLQLTGYPFETQVTCYVLAYDGIHDPTVMAINGASAAMAVSDIPWSGPIGAVRVGMMEKEMIVNPSRHKVCKKLNVIVVATKDRVVMVEGEGEQVDETTFCEAVILGLESVQPILSAIEQFSDQFGKVKRSFEPFLPPDYVEHHMITLKGQISEVLQNYSHSKTSRDNKLFAILNAAKENLLASHEHSNVKLIQDSFWKLVRGCYSNQILDYGVRCDGRLMNELRPISCETNVFTELHGSSLFRRGETEVFSSVTMDVPDKAGNPDIIAAVIGKEKPKKFMLHYDFPSFATNTVSRGPMFQRRRETGHGMLAEKAVQPQVPTDFPFTIRVSCDVTDSNGSSSMASVCGASLALFDAGVPMTTATAGVACGLITQFGIHDDGNFPQYKILTDISGFEDASGNMDFKVAGTRSGITSIQVDVKQIMGLPLDVLKEAVYTSQVKPLEARHQVLDIMDDTVSSPRATTKESTPCSYELEVPSAKRAMVFSSGSNSVKAKVQEEEIYFQDISDTRVGIYAPNKHILEQALPKIKALLIEDEDTLPYPTCMRIVLDGASWRGLLSFLNNLLVDLMEGILEVGESYNFPVAEIRPYGVLLQVTPNTTSLLHVNEMTTEVLQKFNKKALKVLDEVTAYYIGRRDMGRLGVTQKVAIVTEAVRKHKTNIGSNL